MSSPGFVDSHRSSKEKIFTHRSNFLASFQSQFRAQVETAHRRLADVTHCRCGVADAVREFFVRDSKPIIQTRAAAAFSSLVARNRRADRGKRKAPASLISTTPARCR